MRKISLLILVAILAAAALAAWRLLGPTRGGAEILPEVLSVTPASAVIAWTTETPVRGAVEFRPAAGGGGEKEVKEPQEPGFRHEVPLSGLSPQTRYAYRLKGGKSWFLFETQPAGTEPFFFLLVNSLDPGGITRSVLAESPDFVVAFSAPAPGEPDPFRDVRAFVPVFSVHGPVSPFLSEPSAETRSRPWHALDWGGYRMAFVHAPGPFAGMLDSPASFFLIFADPGVVPTAAPGASLADRARATPLHRALLAHNRDHGDRVADLVILLGDKEKTSQEKVDGIVYLAAPSPDRWPAASRVEVDNALVRSVPLDGKPATVLRQPAVARKLTCRECRQLAEKGSYEESVRAYETFVRENAGNFQVDDAEYAIAQICDEKLFDYPRALAWYQRLLADQPDSALAPLARQRIRFITQWDPADFPALAAFERIRNVEYVSARDPAERGRLLARVDGLARANPKSRLAPVMLRWRAGQMAPLDPGAAVNEFMRLQREYPQSPEAADAWMAVGETWYAAGRYRDALAAFVRAEKLPGFDQAARAQAERSRRNIARVELCLFAWIVLALVGLPGLALAFRSPAPGPGGKAALLFAVLGVVLLFVAWLIQEEFSSIAELAVLALSPALAGYAAVRLSAPLALALAGRRRTARALLGTGLSLLFFLAAMYLAVYYVHVHYLITFQL